MSKDSFKDESGLELSEKDSFDDIIFVGASTPDDKIWGYTSPIARRSGSVYGSIIDLFAPGHSITSAIHSDKKGEGFSGTAIWSGTSFVSYDNKFNPTTTKSPQLHHILRRHPTSLELLHVCSATLNIKILPQRR